MRNSIQPHYFSSESSANPPSPGVQARPHVYQRRQAPHVPGLARVVQRGVALLHNTRRAWINTSPYATPRLRLQVVFNGRQSMPPFRLLASSRTLRSLGSRSAS